MIVVDTIVIIEIEIVFTAFAASPGPPCCLIVGGEVVLCDGLERIGIGRAEGVLSGGGGFEPVEGVETGCVKGILVCLHGDVMLLMI